VNYKTYIYYGARRSKDDCSGAYSTTSFAKDSLKDNSYYYNMHSCSYFDWQDIPITGIGNNDGNNIFYYSGKSTNIRSTNEKAILDFLKKKVFE